MLKRIVLSVFGFAAVAALADDVAQLVHGEVVTGYASVPEAFEAAADGDTVKLLANFAPSGNKFSTAKNVTYDLNGFTMSNSGWGDLLTFSGSHLIIRDGKISSQASCVIAGSECQIEFENCTLSGNTAFYSKYGAEISVGTGCRIETSTVLSGSSAAGFTVKVEDGVVTSATLLGYSTTHPVLLLSGGVYKSDPSAFIAPGCKVVATTESGCNWAVEGPQAERVKQDGTIVPYSSVSEAFEAAADGDTVKLLADFAPSGNKFSTSKNVTYDLNGFTMSNSGWGDLLTFSGSHLIIRDGKISSQASCVIAGSECQIEFENCTLSGNTAFYSNYDAEIRVGTGCRIDAGTVLSGNSAAGFTVKVEDGVVTSATLLGYSKTHPVLLLSGGVYKSDPSAFIAPGHKKVAIKESGCNWVVVDEAVVAERVLQDGTAEFYQSVPEAFEAAADGDTVKLLADFAPSGSKYSTSKNVMFDLNGFKMSNSAWGDLLTFSGSHLTIRNGTITSASASCVIAGSACKIEFENCTLSGGTAFYSNYDAEIRVGTGCRIDAGTVLSGNSAAGFTVKVEDGVVTSATLISYSKTHPVLLLSGGVYKSNPLAFLASDRFVRCNPTTGYYDVIPFPAEVTYNLDDSAFVAPAYLGTVPTEGRAVTVNLTSSGQWDERRKCLGDFSAMSNFEGLTFVLGTVSVGLADKLVELRYADGKLYAAIPRGCVIVVR